ncbi:MAG: BirA family transcriptional regulator biotin operon repressor / biotin-acetyl-CoA-carboxylase [Prolixibacteraceae bacterium]|nr:MAG: BirA family transcriptional regulator biotin operon repressor / biotin-acetyl-CoA-carboxylase [Prolixibacteraceae bacterium]
MTTNENFTFLTEVESTNNYANHLVLSKAAGHGTVVLAQYQKMGKGQQGNHWESEPGKNLLMSVIILPQFLPAAKQFYLSKIASLALAGFITNETAEVKIKWPNDIYAGNKKLAGILIENSIKGNHIGSSIIGIGLNLNQERFVSDAPNPVSLKQITGKDYIVEEVALKIWDLLSFWFEKLQAGSFEEIGSSYFNHLFRANEWALFSKEGKPFEARINGIGEFGQLILEERNGVFSEFMFKEIEFVI